MKKLFGQENAIYALEVGVSNSFSVKENIIKYSGQPVFSFTKFGLTNLNM